MKQKEYMTNQQFKGICKSNFALAQYAINLGRFYIHTGRETSLHNLLAEVLKYPNPEHLQDLIELEKIEEETQQFPE